MTLYVLRAVWTETFDDSDYGLTDVCETYDDIAFSHDRRSLDAKAENLARGHVGHWTSERADELRTLWSQYDTRTTYNFVVVDITGLLETQR